YLRGRALHVVDLSSGRDRTLAMLPRRHVPIAWSPDGRWISAGDLLLPVAGGSRCRPLGPGLALEWAPKGGLLAGTSLRGEVVVGRVGERPRRLLPNRWGIGDFDPAGTRLAALGPDRSVVVVDLASGARRVVYRSPSSQVGSP